MLGTGESWFLPSRRGDPEKKVRPAAVNAKAKYGYTQVYDDNMETIRRWDVSL